MTSRSPRTSASPGSLARGRFTRIVARALVAVTVLSVTVVAAGGPADAHAELESTDPPAGAVVVQGPTSARITFNERVGARDGDVRVYDSSGRRVDQGQIQHLNDGRTLQVGLRQIGDGGYAVTWRVISADSHPVSGAVTWRVGEGGAAVGDSLLNRLLGEAHGSTAVRVGLAVQRALLFGGLIVLLGGMAFVLLLWPEGVGDRRWRGMMIGALGVSTVVSIAGIGLQAANEAGLGFGSILGDAPIGEVARGAYGQATFARLIALAAVGFLLFSRRRDREASVAPVSRSVSVGLALLAIVLAGSLGFAGHPRTGRWVAIALPVDVVHVLAASVWIGGLVMLVGIAIPRLDPPDTRRLVQRFSPLAFGCVVVIVATGTAQGFRQLDSWNALRNSDYGHLLIIKVVITAVIVTVGASSRSLVRSGWIDDTEEDAAWSRHLVRRAVGSEALLAVVVIAVTSLLSASDPHALTVPTAFSASRVDGAVIVDAVVAPNKSGPVSVHLYVSDPNASLTEAFTTTAQLELPGKVAPVTLPLIAVGGRHWIVDEVEAPIAGRWRLTVRVVIGDLDEHVLTFDVPIK